MTMKEIFDKLVAMYPKKIVYVHRTITNEPNSNSYTQFQVGGKWTTTGGRKDVSDEQLFDELVKAVGTPQDELAEAKRNLEAGRRVVDAMEAEVNRLESEVAGKAAQ